jgi:SecD/SecF fusion protein
MGSRRRNLLILLVVLGLTAASAIVIATKPTVLGLDLRGGTELVYRAEGTAKNPQVDPTDIERSIEIIRDRTDSLGVSEPEISRIGTDQIAVGLPNVENADRAIEQVGDTAQLYLYDFNRNVVPPPNLPRNVQDPTERPYNRLYDAVKDASKRKPECVNDLCTTKGSQYYIFNKDTLEPYAGGQPAENPQDLYDALPEGVTKADTQVIAVPKGTVVVQKEVPPESGDVPPQYFVFKDQPELTGDEIQNPEQNFDPTTNAPNVTFDFTDEGADSFQTVTARIAQRASEQAFQIDPNICNNPEQADALSQTFAIVLDGRIVSRPIINFCENPEGISGDTGAQISGLELQEAQDLAEFLKIGALPVNLTLISQSTVSASLGQEALDQGLTAGIAGLIIVLLFLVAYYRLLGVVAGLGLLVYAVFFFAMIKLIPITLTLPGIAGLILTIGVAADSNIVIFERIKEEARAGKSMPSAIATGYRKGIATIIDANVITLITAFILFVLATSGVKGFAFTLGIGTIVSLFTAVLFTQAILGMFGRSRILRSPSLLGAGEQRVSWNFDFTGASKWFFSLSGAIIAIGAISFATNQLNLGIDFESGTRIRAGLEQQASVDDVRSALTSAGLEGAENAEITEVDDEELGGNGIQVQGDFSQRDAAQVEPVLEEEFGAENVQTTSIGPTFGEQIARSAVIAIIFSLLVISAYVAIRFEAKYAVPVLIALVHDILITGGVYSLVGREVSSATVAAFLTILGYSMYDTIIVFDRIRENVPRMPRAAFSQIVNRSMSEVFTRSLITGLSTVFLLGMLLVFGGETLRDFAFAMMVGIASGFYSSIFIASPVLTEWKEREPAYRSRRERIVEAMGYVPTFPEDNVVAKIEEAERHVPAPEAEPALTAAQARSEPAAPAAPTEPQAAPAEPPATSGDGADGAAGDGAPAEPTPAEPTPAEPTPAGDELVGAGSSTTETPAERAARLQRERRRKQRRRRKHGRPR